MDALPTTTLALALLLGSCGGGGGDGTGDRPDVPVSDVPVSDVPVSGAPASGETATSVPLADPVALPAALLAVQGDPARIGDIPVVVLTESVASSGLQVAYTDLGQRARIEPLDIADWWDAIQICVEIVAPAPLVIVVAGTVDPFFRDDDVLSDPFTGITASAGPGSDGTPLFQVQENVFERTDDEAGFPLRWIMSRFLWASDGRADRDTPYLCARGEQATRA